MSTITVDRTAYTRLRTEHAAMKARIEHEDRALELLDRRQQLRWFVGGPSPAQMDLQAIDEEIAKLDTILAIRAARYAEQSA